MSALLAELKKLRRKADGDVYDPDITKIAARIGAELFDELDAPVLRVGCPFAPIPFAPELERALLPGSADIVRAVREELRR